MLAHGCYVCHAFPVPMDELTTAKAPEHEQRYTVIFLHREGCP